MNDKVSINVVAYNQEKFLPECLDAILAQTHKNIEIIVADDCSPDRTLEVARAYAAKYPDIIKVVEAEKNGGVVVNATRGLKACTGDYYCTILREHHRQPVRETSYERLLKGNNICATATMVRRKYLPETYVDEAQSVCDLSYYADILVHGDGVYIDKPLVKYRRHSANLSNDERMHHHALGALNYAVKNLRHHRNVYLGRGGQYRALTKKRLMAKDIIGAGKNALLYALMKIRYGLSFIGLR